MAILIFDCGNFDFDSGIFDSDSGNSNFDSGVFDSDSGGTSLVFTRVYGMVESLGLHGNEFRFWEYSFRFRGCWIRFWGFRIWIHGMFISILGIPKLILMCACRFWAYRF